MYKQRIRNICIIVTGLLLVVLGLIYFGQKQNDRKRAAAYAEYQQLTQAHQAEAADLRQTLSSMDKAVGRYGDEAMFVVGFAVSDAGDIPFVKAASAQYGFSPVLVLDCTMESGLLAQVIQEADARWELMFYLPSFSADSMDMLASAKAYLESVQRKDCGVAFCRIKTILAEEASLLKAADFVGCTIYHSSPISGQITDEMIHFDYSHMKTESPSFGDRLLNCYTNQASMICVFDMESIHSGSLSKEKAAECMALLADFSKKEKSSFSSVADTAKKLSGLKQTLEAMDAEREKEKAAIHARLQELEKRMREIYAECFSGIG